jgi:hypothetical protein
MPNSSTGVEFITTALLLQNWLLYAVFLRSQKSLINNLKYKTRWKI